VVKAVATSAAHKRADKAMKQIVGGMMEVSATKYYSNITVVRLVVVARKIRTRAASSYIRLGISTFFAGRSSNFCGANGGKVPQEDRIAAIHLHVK
jgi:hypothetical protein